jgi:hypothetical protein
VPTETIRDRETDWAPDRATDLAPVHLSCAEADALLKCWLGRRCSLTVCGWTGGADDATVLLGWGHLEDEPPVYRLGTCACDLAPLARLRRVGRTLIGDIEPGVILVLESSEVDARMETRVEAQV